MLLMNESINPLNFIGNNTGELFCKSFVTLGFVVVSARVFLKVPIDIAEIETTTTLNSCQ